MRREIAQAKYFKVQAFCISKKWSKNAKQIQQKHIKNKNKKEVERKECGTNMYQGEEW